MKVSGEFWEKFAMVGRLMEQTALAAADGDINTLEAVEIGKIIIEACGYQFNNESLDILVELLQRLESCAKDGVVTVSEMIGTMRWLALQFGYDFDDQGIEVHLFG